MRLTGSVQKGKALKNKYVFVTVMLLILMTASIALTSLYVRHERSDNGDSFQVVTSFYPMYIAAKNIIGSCDGVTLVNLSEPQTGCMHDYQLTAEDMKKLSLADVFVVNGGGIENFLADTAAQYPDLQMVYASERLNLLEDNAHAWMSIQDHMVQVQTIADGLSRTDKSHSSIYQKNCADYLEKLEALSRRQEELAKESASVHAVIFHEAFAYVVRDFHLEENGSMDLDEERQVSAGEVADILAQIRGNGVKLILAEELYGKRMCETVREEMPDVRAVYLDTCVRGDYEADSYLNAMQENLNRLEEGFSYAESCTAEAEK